MGTGTSQQGQLEPNLVEEFAGLSCEVVVLIIWKYGKKKIGMIFKKIITILTTIFVILLSIITTTHKCLLKCTPIEISLAIIIIVSMILLIIFTKKKFILLFIPLIAVIVTVVIRTSYHQWLHSSKFPSSWLDKSVKELNEP